MRCLAVDDAGRLIDFDPASAPPPAPVSIDSTDLVGLACRSADECVALDGNKAVASFNPAAQGTPTFHPLGGGSGARGLACPSTSVCVVSETEGHVQVFNPAAPGTPPQISVGDNRDLGAITCPSATQCTVVGDDGVAATFDPASPPAAPVAGGAGGAARLTVTRVRAHGTTAAFTVRCDGASGRCVGRGYMTVRETRRGKRIVGVTAHGVKPHRVTAHAVKSHRVTPHGVTPDTRAPKRRRITVAVGPLHAGRRSHKDRPRIAQPRRPLAAVSSHPVASDAARDGDYRQAGATRKDRDDHAHQAQAQAPTLNVRGWWRFIQAVAPRPTPGRTAECEIAASIRLVGNNPWHQVGPGSP